MDIINTKSIVSNLENNVDKIAMLYGVVADPIDGGRGIEGALPFMVDRLSHWKLPNPQELLFYIKDPNYAYMKNIKNALMLYIGGYIAGDILGQTRIEKAAKSAATGLIKGTAIAAVAWLPAINSHKTHNMNDFTGNPTPLPLSQPTQTFSSIIGE